VIGPTGDQLGILGRDAALQAALQANMDLVEISPTAEPPVCRIMDFGKFLFEQNKKAHAAKVTLRFRGREMVHQEIGVKLLARVRQDLESIGIIEQMPRMEGRLMVMVISPRKK
jgi:translation initiation factor IF-3